MDEQLLVKKCLDGNERACKELFDRFAPQMLALCLRYSVSNADAEDSLQDGFIKIFQNLSNWKSTGPLGAWIRRIMINTCLTKMKSNYHQNTQLTDEEWPEVVQEPEALSNMAYDDIKSIMEGMPVGYRTVFHLNIIDGYSYEEISSMLKITESTCRSQLFKAKHYLAKRIQQLNPSLKLSI